MISKTEALEIAKGLLKDIVQLDIHSMQSHLDTVIFCRETRLTEVQSWLFPDSLELILNNAHRENINYFEDSLHLRIVLFYLDGMPVLIGPYLSEDITVKQCTQIINHYKLSMSHNHLKIYYGRFPVVSDLQMGRIIDALMKILNLQNLPEHYTFFKDSEDSGSGTDASEGNDISNANLEMHYNLEQKYMNAIAEGNYRKALSYKDILSENSHRLWQKNFSKEMALNSYAVNRAMTRIAAYKAGVPGPIVHQISFEEAVSLTRANNYSQMEKICCQMIQRFCDYISSRNKNRYSALVQSILYTIQERYDTPLTVSLLAADANVSESYMITQFKKETHMTPVEYLRNVRLENAAGLLISSHEKIQEISQRVGIYDSNYFVKLFKQKYELTPRAYRKKYQI
ncbi:MAG TPA: hypothetical protein DCS54_00705 [Oribacterium sp.]|nr:hypothetical protein [Oribacterium sp.]